ncbi:hypothetical protein ACHAWF_007578 [Thalassiosira exigua]
MREDDGAGDREGDKPADDVESNEAVAALRHRIEKEKAADSSPLLTPHSSRTGTGHRPQGQAGHSRADRSQGVGAARQGKSCRGLPYFMAIILLSTYQMILY